MFYRETDGQGDVIDCGPEVLDALQLKPDGQVLAAGLRKNGERRVALEASPVLADLAAQCWAIQDRASDIGA